MPQTSSPTSYLDWTTKKAADASRKTQMGGMDYSNIPDYLKRKVAGYTSGKSGVTDPFYGWALKGLAGAYAAPDLYDQNTQRNAINRLGFQNEQAWEQQENQIQNSMNARGLADSGIQENALGQTKAALDANTLGQANELQQNMIQANTDFRNQNIQTATGYLQGLQGLKYKNWLARVQAEQAAEANKGSGLLGALGGAASGAGTGAAFGPWGALIGGVVGAGMGYMGSK